MFWLLEDCGMMCTSSQGCQTLWDAEAVCVINRCMFGWVHVKIPVHMREQGFPVLCLFSISSVCDVGYYLLSLNWTHYGVF